MVKEAVRIELQVVGVELLVLMHSPDGNEDGAAFGDQVAVVPIIWWRLVFSRQILIYSSGAQTNLLSLDAARPYVLCQRCQLLKDQAKRTKEARNIIRWAPSKSFLDNAVDVRQFLEIIEGRSPIRTTNAINLSLSLLLNFGMFGQRHDNREHLVCCGISACLDELTKKIVESKVG
jgi:hypothetical protein